MNSLTIPGLVADNLGAALAAYALYEIIPGCSLSFTIHQGKYVPVLHSEVSSLIQLADILSNDDTWDRLSLSTNLGVVSCQVRYKDKKGVRDDVVDVPVLGQSQLYMSEYNYLMKVNPTFLEGLATPCVRNERGDDDEKSRAIIEPYVARTPFYPLKRQATFISTISELRKALTLTKVLETLSSESKWAWTKSGQTYGLFPQYEVGKEFRSGKRASGEVKQNVPIISLMSIAAWRLFPVFVSGTGGISTPGWKDDKFYYPIFEKVLNRLAFKTLMTNSNLRSFARNRTAFRRLGILNVYRVTRWNTKELFYFSDPTTL